jgi:hypothetical protein
MSTASTPTLCQCCKRPIRGRSEHQQFIGETCRVCSELLDGVIPVLNGHGLFGMFVAPCPDNLGLPGKEAA